MKSGKILLSGFLLTLLFTALFGTLHSCRHDWEDVNPTIWDNKDSLNTPTVSDTCRFDTIYFVNDILPIFTTNCASPQCHSSQRAEEGIILDNYADIMRTLEIRPGRPDAGDLMEVLNAKNSERQMPPPPAEQLPLELRNAIKIWIEQGAKNNKCQNTCDTSDVRFSNEIWPILYVTCRGCHTGGSPGGGVRINNYSDVKAMATSGMLRGVIEHKPGFKPMPPGGSMDSCAIAKVDIWLRNGAKDD
ncbi:MAG: hypothetical protein H6606_09930 [Flavobacteriales bacterium]|nr:hypothetical protein [Flavobacteriales bacterium]